MLKRWMVVIGLAVAACGGAAGGAGGSGGPGGGGGAGGSDGVASGGSGGGGTGGGGSGGGGGGGTPCASECCPQAPHPCADLDEATCEAKFGCAPVRGALLGDDGEPSGPEVYIGCSSCAGSGDYQTCVVDPAQPSACYQVQRALVPDGWQEVFECDACLSGGG